ncbi:hypothetical protein ALC57_14230 [Trachymyrmex cornetzi]|uniref:Uncharacterized protein n=1 Tax=Trachymyrmex cornetzi TaxID=471704 RepID=A0A195DKW2_9HYME|nr:hypothetical protein ALC57_14230 [Trachymyrmex cornetzi]
MSHIYFIYVDIYPVDKGSHVIGNARQVVTSSSNTGTDYRDCLINSVLYILLNLQKRIPALAYFRHYITLHEHSDVM